MGTRCDRPLLASPRRVCDAPLQRRECPSTARCRYACTGAGTLAAARRDKTAAPGYLATCAPKGVVPIRRAARLHVVSRATCAENFEGVAEQACSLLWGRPRGVGTGCPE